MGHRHEDRRVQDSPRRAREAAVGREHPLVALQRAAGNRAVAGLVQATMTVQRDDDELEALPPPQSPQRPSVLANYNAMGVGAYSPGLLHHQAGGLRLDAGLGEASMGFPVGQGLTGELGYQYGGNAFAGVGGSNWSARVGANPGTGGWGAGIGIGAPLLPMPSTMTGAVNQGYAGLLQAGLSTSAFGPAGQMGGPIGDVYGAGGMMDEGVGLQVGSDPDGLGEYGLLGYQRRF